MYKIDRGYRGSRLNIERFIEYNESGADFVNSEIVERVRKLQLSGEYVVTAEAGRLDLISFRIYGTVSLWWIIALYNRIVDFSEVSSGVRIKYPSIADINNLIRLIS